MYNKALVLLSIVMLLLTAMASAQMTGYPKFNNSSDRSENSPTLRPGMQTVKVGDVNLLVPEGSIIYEQGGILTLEGPSEYAARRFKVIELHLREIDKTIGELIEKVQNLQNQMASPK
jgi:hypothetical protein